MPSSDLPNSPVSIANLLQWLTILMLFVVCGCIFVNVRTQQVSKETQIQDLMRKHRDLGVELESVNAQLKQKRSPGYLASRLRDTGSKMAQVDVAETEELAPPMTVSAETSWNRHGRH